MNEITAMESIRDDLESYMRRIEYWMPLADEVAPKVRSMPHHAWVRLRWFWTPDGLVAREPEIVRRGDSIDWREVAMAGEWISQYDAYQAEKKATVCRIRLLLEAEDDAELDGEPADPDPHYPHPSEIIT